MARNQIIAAASILLAVAAPLLVALKAHHDQQSYPIVRVAIEPYDPRDMFYGHYLMYQIKWNWDGGNAAENACKGDSCCLCVGEGAQDPKVTLMACVPDRPARCTHMLKGSYYGGDRFDIGINRYYVDETVALPLENLFRNEKEAFHVGLSISPEGKTILEKLYVGETPLHDYIAGHYENLTAPPPHDSAAP